MKTCIVENVCTGEHYLWTVTGSNESPCINDILNNFRKKQPDYIKQMFKQRYGCTATVEVISNK